MQEKPLISKLLNGKFLAEKPTHSVTAAALIISSAGVASRLLGMIRDRILAGQFGAGDTLDAYYAAFRVPDFMFNIMFMGALSAAFIPVFTEMLTKEREDGAWKLASGVLSLQIIVTGTLSLILALFFVPQLMYLITPGFSGEKMDLTIKLTRIMFWSPFFLGISGVIGGILMSLKKFLIYSLAPIFYNIGIIVGAVWFVKWWGPVGLAWGVAFGALMHMLVQFPTVFHSGFRFRWMLWEAFRDSGVLKVIKLMIPRTLTIAAAQINLMIITIFASKLVAGSIAVLNFATNIQSAPLGLIGVSFAIAVLPTLSALAIKKTYTEFVQVFSKTFTQILFFVLPLSVFIFMLRAQIVRILLGTGRFDWNDTILTFQTLGILTVGLFAQALIPLVVRAFYALQDTKTPLFVTLFSELLTLGLVFLLIGQYKVYGLAAAFSLGGIVNWGLLLWFLHKRVGNLNEHKILQTVGKITLASFVAALAMQATKYIIGSARELDTFARVLNQLVISLGVGISVFALVCYYLKLDEFFQFTKAITKKLLRSKQQIAENPKEVTGV